MLKRFFAVTRSGSLYEAVVRDYGGRLMPVLRKLALHRESKSPIEEGQEFCEGHFLLIAKVFLVFYIPDEISETEKKLMVEEGMVPLFMLGFNTSPPLGLFLSFDDAWEAWRESESVFDDKSADKIFVKWSKKTCETLDEIGETHPCFKVLAGALSLKAKIKNNEI